MQDLGQGNGVDGYLHITTTSSEAPIDSAATGTASTDALSATNASFAPNQMIMIHQTQGTGAGSWELNFIEAYSAGTITTTFDLVNTYGTGAQVRVVPQYSAVTIDAGVTYSAKAWNGTVGGILFFVCTGPVVVNGALSADEKGFRGGSGTVGVNGGSATTGQQGEGTTNASFSNSTSANGNGGGGGGAGAGDGGSGAGGGGHAASGNNGVVNQNGAGSGGNSSGSTTMTTMTFGGGGGGGGGESNMNSGSYRGGNGGRGGGIIGIYAYSIYIDPSTGSISSNGGAGESATGAYQEGAGGGGGGAGGSIDLWFVEGSFGTNRITATPGTGGNGSGGGSANGGSGANGRIYLNGCSIGVSDSTNPAATQAIGGQDFCQSFIHIWDN